MRDEDEEDAMELEAARHDLNYSSWTARSVAW